MLLTYICTYLHFNFFFIDIDNNHYICRGLAGGNLKQGEPRPARRDNIQQTA